MTIDEPIDVPEPVEQLFLHGYCGENGATGDGCIEFVKTADNIFECKNIEILSKIGYSYGSLWISAAGAGATASTSDCYYPDVDYSTNSGESSLSLIPADSTDPKTFNCKPGKYDIAVDLNEPAKVTFTFIEPEVPEPVEQLFLHGYCGENGANGDGCIEFVKTADNIFECRNIEILAKTGDNYGSLWISAAGAGATASTSDCYYPDVDYTANSGESSLSLIPADSTDPKTFNCKPGKYDIAVDLNEPAMMSITASIETSTDSLIADPDAEPEYYNLQGIRVQNPVRGIYIVRYGSQTTKIRID